MVRNIGESYNTSVTETDGVYYNLWSTNNDKTVPNDDLVIKSVYDPSPVGYSLPASNAFTGFTTTGQNVGSTTTPATPEQINAKQPFDKGWYFYAMPNKTGNNYFFVASGWRFWDSGNMADTYKYGTCWTAGRTSGVQSYFLGFYSSFIYPKHVDNNSYGFAVRSAEEKVENVTIFQHFRFVFLLYTKTYFVHFLSSLY